MYVVPLILPVPEFVHPLKSCVCTALVIFPLSFNVTVYPLGAVGLLISVVELYVPITV